MRSNSIEVYNGRLDKLATQILELCAQGLGLAQDTFTKPFNGTAGDCIARMNYYPPCPLSSLTLGLGAHTDPNLLTILSQCKVGGLQVCKNGTWISVRPKPDTLILNIGDTFEVRNHLPAPHLQQLSSPRFQFNFDCNRILITADGLAIWIFFSLHRFGIFVKEISFGFLSVHQ